MIPINSAKAAGVSPEHELGDVVDEVAEHFTDFVVRLADGLVRPEQILWGVPGGEAQDERERVEEHHHSAEDRPDPAGDGEPADVLGEPDGEQRGPGHDGGPAEGGADDAEHAQGAGAVPVGQRAAIDGGLGADVHERDVERGGSSVGTVEAGKNAYTAEQQVSNEVGIRTDLLRAEDLFVVADSFEGDAVFLEVFVNPLVNLIWLAGLVFLAGAVVTMWPDAREARRLARRFADGEAALARA